MSVLPACLCVPHVCLVPGKIEEVRTGVRDGCGLCGHWELNPWYKSSQVVLTTEPSL